MFLESSCDTGSLLERIDTFLTSPTLAAQPRVLSGCEEQRMVCCKHSEELHSYSFPGARQGYVRSCASQHTVCVYMDSRGGPLMVSPKLSTEC